MSEPPPILDYANPLAGPPPGSRIVVERDEDGVTFTSPPLGLWPYSGDFAGHAVLFALLGWGLIAFLCSSGSEEVWTRRVFTGFFVFGLLLTALSARHLWVMSMQPTIISVRSRRLTIEWPVGIRRGYLAAPVERISDIRVALSGVTVSLRLQGTLVVRTTDGWRCQMLNRHPESELNWLAASMRWAMGRADAKGGLANAMDGG